MECSKSELDSINELSSNYFGSAVQNKLVTNLAPTQKLPVDNLCKEITEKVQMQRFECCAKRDLPTGGGVSDNFADPVSLSQYRQDDARTGVGAPRVGKSYRRYEHGALCIFDTLAHIIQNYKIIFERISKGYGYTPEAVDLTLQGIMIIKISICP